MTSNGTEYTTKRYKTADGYIFSTYHDALMHTLQEETRTNSGTGVEEYNEYYY